MKKRKFLIGGICFIIVLLVLPYLFPGSFFNLFQFFERRCAGLNEKIVQVGDHRIHYLEGGSGETVLLLHGFAANKDSWTRFARYLVPHYHVIAVDLPGFGESTRDPQGHYDIPSQVERLHALIQVLGLQHFHLVGNSMGGFIAGIYTHRFPNQVLSLGLFDTSGVKSSQESEYARLLQLNPEDNPLFLKDPEDFDKVLEFLFVEVPFIPSPIKRYLAAKAVTNKDFYEKVFKQIGGIKQYSLQPLLPEIEAPTLILWGDSDWIFPVDTVAVLAAGLPNSKTVIMKQCGHVPMLERPKESAGHYLEFLEWVKNKK